MSQLVIYYYKVMDKKKILETLGEVIMGIVILGVGTLVTVTAGTFLYQMIMAMFD